MFERKHMISTMFIFLALACSHTQAVWEHTPQAVTRAPTTEVAVVASDHRCQAVADGLALELSMRDGVRVVPDARTRLLLNLCQLNVRTEVDIEQWFPVAGMEGAGVTDRREQVIRGEGRAVLTVEFDGQPINMVKGEGHRIRLIRDDDPAHLQRRSVVRADVLRDVSEALAQQIAPVPEVVRRRWYRNPEPGTSRALHNQAVDAERAGDLSAAIRYAQQARDALRTPASVRYLNALEQRRAAMEYAENQNAPTSADETR